MPGNDFKKYLLSRESLRQNRYLAVFGTLLHHHNLWHWNRRSVAGGVAAGMFTGLIPGSNPVQFTAAAVVSIVFKVNLPVAVFVTLYTNPFIIVPLYYLAYKLGAFVTGQSAGDVPHTEFSLSGKSINEWISALVDWLASLGKPLAVGLPLLAALLAVTGYIAVRWAWRLHVVYEWRKRRRGRLDRSQATP